MGEVYRAHDSRLHRDVAIKVLPERVATDHERIARFELEARATAALNHPNIVALYDVGTDRGTAYVVSELLTGSTLRDRIQEGPIPLRKVVEIGLGILNGLAAAHERGISHRDLKPENVFVTDDGTVKILDFGLAKLSQPPGLETAYSAATVASPHTTPGVVLGTLGYMAPEQVRGLQTDHRSDVFAFGAIVFEMLTGRPAFHGATPADTMTAILSQDPPDLSSAPGRIPPAMSALIRRCLEKDQRHRFQSARDLAFALEAVAMEGGSGSTTSLEAPAPPRVAPSHLGVGCARHCDDGRCRADCVAVGPSPGCRDIDAGVVDRCAPGGSDRPDARRLAGRPRRGLSRHRWVRFASLPAVAEHVRPEAGRRFRWRGGAVLVAGQPIDLLFRAGPIVARGSRGRPAAVRCERLQPARRHVGTRQRHRVLAATRWRPVSRTSGRRHARGADRHPIARSRRSRIVGPGFCRTDATCCS